MSTYAQELKATAKALVAKGKGILAIDESNGTCNKRFAQLNIPTTEENRRTYRELILTTPKLSTYISGPICLMRPFDNPLETVNPLYKSLLKRVCFRGLKWTRELKT